jgi:hypothetical protein
MSEYNCSECGEYFCECCAHCGESERFCECLRELSERDRIARELAAMRELLREREQVRERVLGACLHIWASEQECAQLLSLGENKIARVLIDECASLLPYLESELYCASAFGLLSKRERARLLAKIERRAVALFLLSARERASASAYLFARARERRARERARQNASTRPL